MDLALLPPPTEARGPWLVDALRQAILTGRLGTGAKLPASRTLAAQLAVSRGVVVAAYEELVSEGYCAARVGDGTYVTLSARPALTRAGDRPPRLSAWANRLGPVPHAERDSTYRFDFRSGIAPETFPAAALTRALRTAAERLARESGAGDPAGSERLRRALAAHLGRTRGLRADPAQVIIVSGSQQALDLAARLLLDPGDGVLVEEPGYPRARRVFSALGAPVCPVGVDAAGLRTDELPGAGIRLAYVTPSHQFPTGAVLAPERRLELLRWADSADAWVLEDDYDSEFRYGGPPLPCLQGLDRAGRCLYVGSLSKLLHPALRAGYLIVPPALVDAVTAAKNVLDQATTPLVQEALAELFESGEIERHLRRANRAYRARRARLLAALADTPLPGATVWPVTGGLHCFVELPDISPEALRRAADRHGIAFVDGGDCFGSPLAGSAMLLWFSRIAPEGIAPGIAALAGALAAARAGQTTPSGG